jgi:hypothetical protein
MQSSISPLLELIKGIASFVGIRKSFGMLCTVECFRGREVKEAREGYGRAGRRHAQGTGDRVRRDNQGLINRLLEETLGAFLLFIF